MKGDERVTALKAIHYIFCRKPGIGPLPGGLVAHVSNLADLWLEILSLHQSAVERAQTFPRCISFRLQILHSHGQSPLRLQHVCIISYLRRPIQPLAFTQVDFLILGYQSTQGN